MGLRLRDHWLWDFWLARDGDDYHAFYLQAPRSLGDPDLRHWHVSIGHAVSNDLVRWELLPDALAPGPPGAWDDYSTWTGSIIRESDGWAMLYTGTARAEEGLVQRIGRAWSADLVTWERDPNNPVMAADYSRYERLDRQVWHEEAWRDPWLFRDPGGGRMHALVTARVAAGDPLTRGVLALARADGDGRWDVLPPITQPGRYGHLEVPQLVRVGDRWCLLFSVPGPPPTDDPRPGAEWTTFSGTHFLVADDPFGPFDWESHGALLADRAGSWYGAKLVEAPDGSLVALAWLNRDASGDFVGELSDPMPVEVEPAGPRVRDT